MFKPSTLAALVIVLAVGSALAQNSSPSGIDIEGMDRSVRPQDDFVRYVNGTWIDNTPTPPDAATYSAREAAARQTQQVVSALIDEIVRTPQKEGSLERKIRDFYGSFMDEARIERLGLQPLAAQLAVIDDIRDPADLAPAFATIPLTHWRVPFSSGVEPDPRNPRRLVVTVSQAGPLDYTAGLGTSDRELYLRSDARTVAIRAAYAEYIAKLFALARWPDPAGAATRIIALETELAKHQWDSVRERDRDATYNTRTLDELQALAPHVNWRAYFGKLLSPAQLATLREVLVRQPDYVSAVDALLVSVPIVTWKEYLKFGLLSRNAELLSSPFVETQFAFRGRTLDGRRENTRRSARAIGALNTVLGEAIGHLYADRYFKLETKQQAEVIVRNLRRAFAQLIDEIDWMSPETKTVAKAKLAKYRFRIGTPDKWNDFAGLDIKATDLLGNMHRFRALQQHDMWAQFGRSPGPWRFPMNPLGMGGNYSPADNGITLGAALFQPPYFHPGADAAANYGGVGAFIAHEMSHGFDDQGRKSDGDGNVSDWWKPDEVKAYDDRAAALAAQYESYEPLPGLRIDGRRALSESIADGGGAAIAYRAYQLSLNGKTAPVIDGFTGDQRFFIGYAQVYRAKPPTPQELLTLNRAPAMYRGFVPLTNMDPFFTAFNIKPGDKLYRPPSERVKFW